MTLIDILKKEAEMIRGMGHKPLGKHHSYQDFVLKHGIDFSSTLRSDDDVQGSYPAKQCFMNCFTLATAFPKELIYCEGYTSCFGIPIYHAWLMNRQGLLVDPTLPEPAQEYFGVPIKLKFVREMLRRSNTAGVIDQPHLKWPILTRPKKDWIEVI